LSEGVKDVVSNALENLEVAKDLVKEEFYKNSQAISVECD
jgi:hypothetical protein